MKPFREQFIECRRGGVSVDGPLQKFKDHPELIPHPICSHKAAVNVAKALEKNPDAGLVLLVCSRFGGRCSSGNPDCKKMRENFLDEKKSSV